jgi:hypothetical protein
MITVKIYGFHIAILNIAWYSIEWLNKNMRMDEHLHPFPLADLLHLEEKCILLL